MVSDLALGDMVTWTSQANGSTRMKVGPVVGIVPAQRNVWDFLADHDELDASAYDLSNLATEYYRTAISYLIAVTMHAPTGKVKRRPKLYWPRVERLRRVVSDEVTHTATPSILFDGTPMCCTTRHGQPVNPPIAVFSGLDLEEHAALRRDAIRYRYFKERIAALFLHRDGTALWILPAVTLPRALSVDAAVDAAMGREEESRCTVQSRVAAQWHGCLADARSEG